jgi:carbon-monoxide dehydrogenase medium subunit
MVLPTSVEECLRALADRGPDARVVAGGTDLVPQLKAGMLQTGCVVDLSGVKQLRQLARANGSGLRIGAAVTARTLERDAAVKKAYPALSESGALVGSVQVRNLATLGGTLCNAAPSADMAPPLLALDAEAVIAGPNGTRRVPLASFFLGVRRTVLEPGELLVEIVVPAPRPHSGGTKARIALAAVAPTPVRATAAERLLEGQPVTPELIERAAAAAVEAARPISDQRGSADFRRHLVQVLTRRTLTTALARASA